MRGISICVVIYMSLAINIAEAQNRLHSRVFYNYPNLHNSLSRFSPKIFKNYSTVIFGCDDKRFYFLGEKVYKKTTQNEIEEIWRQSAKTSVQGKMVKDLKEALIFQSVNGADITTQGRLKIYPTIEVFYTDVRGFLFWCKSFAKVRIKCIVNLDEKEILNDKYESFYITTGNDSEWEGGKWATIEEGANITIGVALRQALDKFYLALEEKLE